MSYLNLIKDLKGIVDEGYQNRRAELNLTTTHTNWEIGKRLVQEEQNGRSRAAYATQTLQKLSDDLRNRYGRGFGLANLRNMRQFFQMYLKPDIKEELSWTHYLELLRVRDHKVRSSLENLIIQKNMSPGELRRHIMVLRDGKNPVDELERPVGSTGILQMRLVVEDGREFSYLDFGFGFWMQPYDNEFDGFADRQMVTATRSKSGMQLNTYTGDPRNMWLYRARLDRVVDGDTIVVFIDCGPGIRVKQILRLRRVNAAAPGEASGLKARKYVEKKLEQSGFMMIKTRKRDKYARYVADVLVGKKGQNEDDVIRDGLFLNQALLDRGLAVRVD